MFSTGVDLSHEPELNAAFDPQVNANCRRTPRWGCQAQKAPTGRTYNRFELVTAKISAAPLGLEIIAWKISQGVALG